MKFDYIIFWILKILIVLLVFLLLYISNPMLSEDLNMFLLLYSIYIYPGILMSVPLLELTCDIISYFDFCQPRNSATLPIEWTIASWSSFIFYVIVGFILFKIIFYKQNKNQKFNQ